MKYYLSDPAYWVLTIAAIALLGLGIEIGKHDCQNNNPPAKVQTQA